MKKTKGTEVYGEVRRKTLEESSSPEELIMMLFEKSCVLLRASVNSLSNGDNENFHKTSLHALQIVVSLRYVLDTKKGDSLSASLYETYTAIAASLLKAKEKQDPIALGKIYESLNELKDAWGTLLSKR